MPQVYFSTTTFTGRDVNEDYKILIDRLLSEHRNFLRYLRNPYLLKEVYGFNEAVRDDFNGWHLHHLMGEYIPLEIMRKKNLYWGREPYELIFLNQAKHLSLHHKKEEYY